MKWDRKYIHFFVRFYHGPPGAVVFLKLSFLRNKNVGYLYKMDFSDRLALHGEVVDTLVDPRVEALEWFVGIEGLSYTGAIRLEVRCQYYCVLTI